MPNTKRKFKITRFPLRAERVLHDGTTYLRGHLSSLISSSANYVATGAIKSRPLPAYHYREERCTLGVDTDQLRTYRDLHKNERCFVIGNGPSLNLIDITKLNNEITFAANGIYYKTRETGFRPTYYTVEDSHVIEDNRAEIDAYRVRGQKFLPTDYRYLIHNKEAFCFFVMNRGFYEPQSPKYGIPHFSVDPAERLYCGQSVTMMNLQLAHYMGFKSVYLVGMDFSYTIPKSARLSGDDIESTGDDPNHFHPDYFGAGKRWHQPKLANVRLNYELARFVYGCTGRKIVNVTVGGKLDIFDRADFDSLF